MSMQPPLIDERSEKDIVAQVQALLKFYVPDWNEIDSQTQQPVGASAALINIFARFGSLIIERINRAPEKNFLAFLDLLGASLLPPEPARVPVTFSLTAGSTADAIVPQGTQVAAPPAQGEKDPVIYETEKELVVTSAQLTSLFVRDPDNDRYSDQSAILTLPSQDGVNPFQGGIRLDHILYIGFSDVLAYPLIKSLDLSFGIKSGPGDPRSVQWEVWDSLNSTWSVIPDAQVTDGTADLKQKGHVIISNLSEVPSHDVTLVTSRWLRSRLMTPITLGNLPQAGMVRANGLPTIETFSWTSTVEREGLQIEHAFANGLPLDVTKDFYPFGEKPKFGDTLYLANGEAFSQLPDDTQGVNLEVTLSDNIKLDTTVDAVLAWEYWNGTGWKQLDKYDASREKSAGSFTANGSVTLKFSEPAVMTTINGISSYWIRVRLIGGDYGKEAGYEPIYSDGSPKKITGYQFVPAGYTPPSIQKLTVGYTVVRQGKRENLDLLTYNDFDYDRPGDRLIPFRPTQDSDPSFYLGFTLPVNRPKFPNQTLSFYVQLVDITSDQAVDNPSPTSTPRLVWEYWNGMNWVRLIVNDETVAFTRSGLVEILPPADFLKSKEFGQIRYWIRVRWESGDYTFLPRLQTILQNTTMAAQTVTIRNELLGSSNGTQNQIFHTTRSPVLQGELLQIREPELTSNEELKSPGDQRGRGEVIGMRDGTDRQQESWIPWQAVPDFYGSGARDRHYVIDHLTGEIRFGDGVNGRIPPVGIGNIRLSVYKTGGGQHGNRSAGSIVQLKTTVPYVDKVINHADAAGGSDAEAIASLMERAPRTIRHRDRAVTIEDYEDLAMLSTPEVARVKCVPLYDLAVDRDATVRLPGTVSVIVVPHSSDPKPLPDLELIEKVQRFLDDHRIPTANLIVVGPEYLKVNVLVEVAVTSLNVASRVELAVSSALRSFLHPLTGGLDGVGWDFGRQPYQSDVYALLEAIPGVDHIRTLQLNPIPERAGAENTGRFLVFAGQIDTRLTLDEA